VWIFICRRFSIQNDEQFKTFAEELEKHCELDKVGRCYYCFVAESFLFMIHGHEYYRVKFSGGP
jgi:hypothetical protein